MVVGWYHSHPGFGCWLSSVDVNTQQVGPQSSNMARQKFSLLNDCSHLSSSTRDVLPLSSTRSSRSEAKS